jgi:aspartate racemase
LRGLSIIAKEKSDMTTSPLIGILAGMGPRSTGPFIDLVITECQAQYGARDDIDFPKMMICSQPAPFYEDRPTDHPALEAAIRDGLQHLERTGADFLAIACNTAHIYYPQLATSVSVPLLNMVDLAVAQIPKSARRVGLIAARPTVEAEIYQTALRDCGFEVEVGAWQDSVDHLLGTIRTTTNPAEFRRQWAEILAQVGADMVLVACLDLTGILPHAVTHLPIVDAAQALAHEIVREWLRRHGDAP